MTVVVFLQLLAARCWCQGRVEGRVTTDGLPANRVWVRMVSGEQAVAGGWTDETGRFELTAVPRNVTCTLLVSPASEILASAELTLSLHGEAYRRQDIEVINLLHRPLMLADLTVMATAYPGRGSLPDGRVDLHADGRLLGTVHLGSEQEAEIDKVLVPIGPIQVIASDRYGVYRPDTVILDIRPGQTAYRADFTCGIVMWKPLLALLALALPAIQELVRRRIKARESTLGGAA